MQTQTEEQRVRLICQSMVEKPGNMILQDILLEVQEDLVVGLADMDVMVEMVAQTVQMVG